MSWCRGSTRHDDHGVLEVHLVALRVGERPSSRTLRSVLNTSGWAFSISSNSTHAVRLAADGFGELAALLVPNVAGRRADEPGDRVLFHVLGHVELDDRVLVAEQKLGQRLGSPGLAHPGRSHEHERADRPVRVGQAGAGAADRFDTAMTASYWSTIPRWLDSRRSSRSVSSSVSLTTGMPVERDTTSAISSVSTSGGCPPRRTSSRALGGRFRRATAAPRRAARPRARSPARRPPILLQPDLVHLPSTSRTSAARSCAPRGCGLVDEVDGLVRQEPVGDVAVGEARCGDQRVVGEATAGGAPRSGRASPPGSDGVVDRSAHGTRIRAGNDGPARRLFSMRLRYSLRVVAPIVCSSPAGEHRFEHVAGVDAAALAAGTAGADQRVQLVEENASFVVVGADLVDDLLQPFLEVTAVAGARDQRPRDRAWIPASPEQRLGHLAA